MAKSRFPLPALGQDVLYPYEPFREPARLGDVFCGGNEKLGGNVLTFSLPAVYTCTGSTSLCRTLCYACRPQSRFGGEEVQARYWENWRLSLRPDFVDSVVRAYGRLTRGDVLTRLHVSGDFYSPAYAGKWLAVMGAVPRSTFWLYTRGWRDPALLPALESMAGLANVFVWYSCDLETGRPESVPFRVRLAYLMVHDGDVPPYPVDLCFRDRPLTGGVVKFAGRALVCPAENGISRGVTCEKCRVCLRDRPVKRLGP